MIGLLIGAALVVASLVCVSLTLFIEGHTVMRTAPLTFEQWLNSVDAMMTSRVGVDSGSVEDWPWYTDFESGLSPHEAVNDWCAEHMIPRALCN